MKITKFVHSCLLVEMPEPINRTALFDPGTMSSAMLRDHKFEYLDDIFITHGHPDHIDIDYVKELVAQFPDVRITAPTEVVEQLKEQGIAATDQPSDGVTFFDAPHEDVQPMFPVPQEIGIHYLDLLSHPGDSHSFHETKAVLALPMTAPWGATVKAVQLAHELKPKYIVPIHDWHWRDEARDGTYESMEKLFAQNDITFIKAVNGEPFVLDI